jgi:hypothetical protein
LSSIPEHNGRPKQIQAAGPITLLFEAAVADLAPPVEEDGSGQCVAGFPFIQANMNTPMQFNALRPVQGEQGMLNSSRFAKRHSSLRTARNAQPSILATAIGMKKSTFL